MTVKSFTCNPFMTNCYICHDGGEAILVDASSHNTSEHKQLTAYVEQHDLTMRHLLLTHAHIDHIFGCSYFADYYGEEFQMHPADEFLIERSMQQATAFGVQLDEAPSIGRRLDEGDRIQFGSAELEVLHTPGHSPGSITFVERDAQIALSGDVLFRGSIGRIQGLPKTSKEDLLNSIETKLLPLGDETRILPGHGAETTIGRERKSNPFLQEMA